LPGRPRRPDVMQSNPHNRKLGRVNDGYARNAPGERHTAPNSDQCVSWGSRYKVRSMPLRLGCRRLHRLGPHPGDETAEVCRSKPSGDSVGDSLAGLSPRCFLAVWVGRAASQKKGATEPSTVEKGVSIASRSPQPALGSGIQEQAKPSTARESAETGCTESGQSGIHHGHPLLYGKQLRLLIGGAPDRGPRYEVAGLALWARRPCKERKGTWPPGTE
jgi:hypothetical protein